MNITILDSKNIGLDIDYSELEKCGNLTIYQATLPEEIISHAQNADCLIFNKIRFTSDILSKLPNLKLICVTATGYDNVDVQYCKNNSIALCNVVGYSTNSVAQITVALALSLYSKLSVYDKYVKNTSYTKSNSANLLSPTFNEIYGKTWGIVGYGNIGKAVAKVARALGCNVIAFSRTPKEDVQNVSLDELLCKSNIVSLHLPASDETQAIINKERLSLMKKDAVLINVARGAITDEDAIADAIISENLGGFATDVYTKEPFDENHPFNKILSHDNVILTPHMAWAGIEARERLIGEIAQNIKSFQKGENRNRIC